MLTPPRLRNDCFAMPQGVEWIPVDTALARLHERLHPVTRQEELLVHETLGPVLATDCIARRSNPPAIRLFPRAEDRLAMVVPAACLYPIVA